MSKEPFQPISVKSPTEHSWKFRLRCFLDLQLRTIAGPLKNQLSHFPKGKIIDIGAGESPWRGWLPSNCAYTGIDVNNSNEFGMKQRGDILLYDGTTIPLASNTFDGSICIEVLEHADDPNLLISEISRILKPGAPLILTTPWSARRHHIPHDYHRFTRERLYAILSKNGFENISIEDRGNEYCVIFNKTLILLITKIKTLSITNSLYTTPLILILATYSIIFLTISHLSLMATKTIDSENLDPLGYYCKAQKQSSSETQKP